MSEIRIAKRYADALMDLSLEKNLMEEVYQNAEFIIAACDSNRDLSLMINSPIVKGDAKQRVLNKVFSGKINEISLHFINLLIRKRRETYLIPALEQFIKTYKAKKGIVDAFIQSSISIPESLKEKIKGMIKGDDYNEVNLHEEINEDLIGGFILRIDDKLVDNSVSSQLKRLQKSLLN